MQRVCGVVVSHSLSKRKAPSSILGKSIFLFFFVKKINFSKICHFLYFLIFFYFKFIKNSEFLIFH